MDKDGEGGLCLNVHTGSRHLEKEVMDYCMREGARRLKERGEEVPYLVTWLEGNLMEDYIEDVKTAREYTQLTRKVIIPVNMRDGIILGTGKGSPEWNGSAPRGSGRRMWKIVQISAGQGLEECQIAVEKLFEAWKRKQGSDRQIRHGGACKDREGKSGAGL